MAEQTHQNGNAVDPDDGDPDSVAFHYIKSNHFRVVHVEGVIGGPNPHLQIAMSVWNERIAIPQSVVHDLNEDKSLGKERKKDRVGRTGFVREVEATLIFDAETARKIADWLGSRIAEIEKVTEKAKGKSEGENE